MRMCKEVERSTKLVEEELEEKNKLRAALDASREDIKRVRAELGTEFALIVYYNLVHSICLQVLLRRKQISCASRRRSPMTR